LDELQPDGDCSLREAVQSVNTGQQFDNCGPGTHNDPLPTGPYLISLKSGDYTLLRTGAGEDNNSTGDLDLLASVTIQGASAALTRINGGAIDRVLDIDPTTAATITVTLANLTLENGLAPAGTDGGGIRNQGDTLHVRDSIINDNTIQLGMPGELGSGDD
jgi:CSLREA domain-containing protein